MNKRLFLQLLLAAGTLSASAAYEPGTYIYTSTARLKINSADNLLINGNFSVANPGDGAFGWKSLNGTTLSAEDWQVRIGAGPGGGNALEALRAVNSDGADVSLLQTVPYTPGQSLVVSFKIKAPAPVMSSVKAGSTNYVDVYANADGSVNKSGDGFKQVASSIAIGQEWTEASFSFSDTSEGGQSGYLVLALSKLATGTQVADFTVQDASEVYDDRPARKLLSFGQYLIKSGEMPVGADEFGETISTVSDYLASPEAEDPNEAAAYMDDYKTQYRDYLDKNSADMSGKIDGGTDFTSWVKTNAGTLKANGDWTFTGGRWGHSAKSDVLSDFYQGGYTKNAGQASFTTEGLPAGRYMFAVDAQAYTMIGGKAKYDPDYTYNLPYLKVFIGADSVTYENVSNTDYTTYTKFSDYKGGEPLTAGISYPEFPAGKGGRFNIKNVTFRMLGITGDEMKRRDYVASIYTQMTELKNRLDSAATIIAGPLPWGKASLKDSVDKFTPLYEASFAYVGEDGSDKGIDIPDAYDETLRDNVVSMGRAIARFYKENDPFTDLQALTVEAKNHLDGEPWKDADAQSRANLQTAWNSSTAMIDNVTVTTDSLNFRNAYDDLKHSIVAFERSCARYPYGADEYVLNPFFQQNGGSGSDEAYGWTIIGDGDASNKFKFGKNERFEGGNAMYTSRGNTVYMKNKASQKLTISKKGYYEFRCQAYAFNSDRTKYGQLWNGQSGEDSARVTGIFVYFGPDEAQDKDKIEVCTSQTTFGSKWVPDEIRTYKIFFNKTDDADLVMEFGIDALQNGVEKGVGCNLYGFGGVHVFFWGDKDQYEKDYAAGIDTPAADLLNDRSSAVYNLMGVKVAGSAKNLPKGIYISNGKKFVIK